MVGIGDVLGGRNPLEALRDWWGQRVGLRRTNSDAALTKAVMMCHVLEDELKIVGMRALAEQLMEGRAGDSGWDTEMTIRAVEAASPKPTRYEMGNGKKDG